MLDYQCERKSISRAKILEQMRVLNNYLKGLYLKIFERKAFKMTVKFKFK